jgi:GrpB-like predicted nucleotidyltransferase (UPF0157 family)
MDEVVIVEYDPNWVFLFEREAAHYGRLKYNFARRFSSDREAYTMEKAEYIESVMQKARQQPAS